MTSWQPFSEFQAFRAHGEAAPLPPPPLPSDALAPPAMSPIPIESRTERLAVWSLVLSLLSLVFCGLILGIPGVICGHLALSKIRKTPDLQGGGLAISGVIVGYVAIALWLIYLVILLGLGISKIGNPPIG